MLRVRGAAALVGAVFGLMLCWSGMTSPDVIRDALLFKQAYLFAFMFAAVATATLGLWLVRRSLPWRALLTGQPIGWTGERPRRSHFVGALMFGAGWGLTDVCPGPVATQLGQGIAWALPVFAGVVLGVWLFQRQGASETEPAADQVTERAMARPAVRPLNMQPPTKVPSSEL